MSIHSLNRVGKIIQKMSHQEKEKDATRLHDTFIFSPRTL